MNISPPILNPYDIMTRMKLYYVNHLQVEFGVTLKFMNSLTQQTLCGHIFTGRHYLDPIVTLKAEYKFLWLVTGNMANRQNYDDITIMREVNHYTDTLYKIYKHHQEVMSTNRYYQNIPDDVPTESIVTGAENGYNDDIQGIQKT